MEASSNKEEGRLWLALRKEGREWWGLYIWKGKAKKLPVGGNWSNSNRDCGCGFVNFDF